jgi:hypoxanthine-DNA glycosylase
LSLDFAREERLKGAMIRKASFPPVVAPDTRVLILGSLPGERSLAEGRYYAHPRNLFWRLTGEAIGRDLEALAYEARLEALLAAGIGLWDTVASATRTGSLDAAIREAEHNPLVELAARLRELRAVAFNGAASAKIGTAALAGGGLTLLPLPSSSPANASVPYAEKLRLWRAIGEFLA